MHRAHLVLAALVLSGCGQLEVRLPGAVRGPALDAVGSHGDEPLVLAFDRLGHLTLNGQALELPQARERVRFGIGVVDAGALPPPWRPAHARDGGLLVASLEKASPLAVAGLRPFDRIAELDDEPVGTPAELARRLGDTEPGAEVRLGVVRASGEPAALVAAATERVGDDQRIWVPLLFELRSSATGKAFGAGPFDLLFRSRSRLEHRYVLEGDRGHSLYEERFGWDVLGGLLGWESLTDPVTGEGRSALRLFWIPLGDDL